MAPRIIAVIDGNSLMHRAFHALPETLTAPDGRPTNAVVGFVNMLVKMMTDLKPGGVVVAFDAGLPAFRKEALEQYKVQRPPTADALKQQFPMVRKLLDAMAIPVVQLAGWEGDDILGSVACHAENSGYQVLLVTGDKDAFQLVTDNVKVVTTRKGLSDIVVYGPAEVEERYGVTPAQVPDYLGLKGDTSDNIPGVPGVGEKTAAKLLQQYGTLEEVIAHAGEIGGKVGSNIAENKDKAFASRTVATITCDVEMALDFSAIRFGGWDPAELAAAFGELRMTSVLERVLALDAGSQTSAAIDVSTEVQTPTRVTIRGADAMARVREWAQRPGGGWLGVAFGDAQETLFAPDPPLAVASPEEVAVVEPADAQEALVLVAASGCLAAADVKALLQQVCPADESVSCRVDAAAYDGVQMMDVGVASYLLESARSSYEVRALAPDYLGMPLPLATDDHPTEAIAAGACADLAAVLSDRLQEDGSFDVYRQIEMPLIPVLLGMERIGVGVDTDVLAALADETRAGIETLRAEIHQLAGCEFTVDSPKQLGEVLFDKLGLPHQKKTKTGYSTDASVLKTLAPMHPIAEKIIAYRELTKLTSTYLDALPRMLGGDGRLHTSFNQTVAATGRLSSSNPNLQNIPVRTDLGKRIRAAFVPAREGDLMVAADYSQIELRILAHLSGDTGLIEAFTSGRDFHQATASRVFGVDPDAVTPAMRARAKAVNFGIVYGQSAHGLADTLKIGRADAQTMIDRYYDAYPRVRAFLDETVADAKVDGCAVTMFGRKRRIPELRSSNYNLRSFGERTAMNHPMQGTAADIIKLAMIEVDRRLRSEGFSARMVLQVHDELVFECPPVEVDRLSRMAVEAMAGVADLAVPLEVGVGVGPNWAEAK